MGDIMIPTISRDCIATVCAKAVQGGTPDSFAHDFMLSLKDDQPEMFSCLYGMSENMINSTKIMTENDMMDVEDAIAITSWMMTGLLYKSLKGQIESDELSEMFRI